MTVRRLLFATLGIGLAGAGADLVLLDHYADFTQIIPLALIACALVMLGWHLLHPSRLSGQLFRATMILFLLAGAMGSFFHMQGAAEFQREMDPSVSGWTLFTKVIRAKAPPALAPGVMIQLGLIGLTITFLKGTRT